MQAYRPYHLTGLTARVGVWSIPIDRQQRLVRTCDLDEPCSRFGLNIDGRAENLVGMMLCGEPAIGRDDRLPCRRAFDAQDAEEGIGIGCAADEERQRSAAAIRFAGPG